jgi:hypothetical protein
VNGIKTVEKRYDDVKETKKREGRVVTVVDSGFNSDWARSRVLNRYSEITGIMEPDCAIKGCGCEAWSGTFCIEENSRGRLYKVIVPLCRDHNTVSNCETIVIKKAYKKAVVI